MTEPKYPATQWAFSIILGALIGSGLIWGVVAVCDWVSERFGPGEAFFLFIAIMVTVLLGCAFLWDLSSRDD